MDSWVIHDVVMAFHSSPDAEPTNARAFGILQVTLLINSLSMVSTSQRCPRHPNVPAVRILIATTGVLPATPVSELCTRLLDDDSTVTVMTVIRIPRTFLDSLEDEARRSFLDDSADDAAAAEEKAARYLEERGQKVVQPIVAALIVEGIQPDVRFVEGDDPAQAIIETAEKVDAQIVMMGATRRLFTEEAWRSVSARVIDTSHLPVLLVPGHRIEDTHEMPVLEL